MIKKRYRKKFQGKCSKIDVCHYGRKKKVFFSSIIDVNFVLFWLIHLGRIITEEYIQIDK